MKSGQLELPRLQHCAEFLDLMFRYSDQEILQNGSYQDQLRAFSQGQAVFTIGSGDLDPSFQAAGVTFEMGFLPLGHTRWTQMGSLPNRRDG
jgi:raffinose/stachyose/melibiose transport system substrate-binding protein